MCNHEPSIKDDAVYNVKETCEILGISRDTLTDRRKKGFVIPVNPHVARGYRYTGASIKRLWRLENYLPV